MSARRTFLRCVAMLVAIGIGATSTAFDNDTFTNLSPSGLALFDAAVDWAAGR